VKPPEVRYADSPEGKIAYQVVGDGPLDLVLAQGPRANLDVVWEHPAFERYLRRLASFSRLILCNFRGTGLSDPIPFGAPPTFEEWTMDFRWVLDAVESKQAAFLATDGDGLAALLFAATFPERTRALALINCFATLRRHQDYPSGLPDEVLDRFVNAYVSDWGSGQNLRWMAPEHADDPSLREWLGRLERLSASPSIASASRLALTNLDLRGILPSIKAPTLVISHAQMPWIRPDHGRYVAEHVADGRFVERPGFWGLKWVHDVEWTLDEVQSFFTGTRGASGLDDRVLATVLFTDIIGSTERAAGLGDQRWRWLLDEHDALTRREIVRFRGRPVKSTGDGFLATFDGPARAIRCALALTEVVRPLGIQMRTGLHTGEVELRDEDVGGIAVHIAARVMREAGAGEVLVSGSVPPLVAGSGIAFDDRGVRPLKAVPGEWRLFAVKASASVA
jgi:class 3 adenylate cyclase/pimeloyl-ACP methyl ester carboxylesterase